MITWLASVFLPRPWTYNKARDFSMRLQYRDRVQRSKMLESHPRKR